METVFVSYNIKFKKLAVKSHLIVKCQGISLLTIENSKDILQGVCSKYFIRNRFYSLYLVYRKLFTATRKCVCNADLLNVIFRQNNIMY